MLEAPIERTCCKKARELYGIKNIKLFKLLGWPDRIFYKKGKVCFAEFKQPGEKPRKLQLYIHKELREDGFTVLVIDDIIKGLQALKEVFSDET